MARQYTDAIAALNTLQSNFAIVSEIQKSRGKLNELAIPEMIEWCQKMGYQPSDFNKLNLIHIAGTKGKGSTAAFTSSILTQFLGQKSTSSHNAAPLSKIGLYTSPHLRFVRERIQINGQPLTEKQFTKYFFEVWDRFEDAAAEAGRDPKAPSSKPVYFRFLTLMAFHAYVSEGVDAAIIECGIGGAYDSTNILEKPVVTAITSLGIDHVGILGSTLPEIAWHKAGVMKPESRCFSPMSQAEEAKPVLNRVAKEKRSEITYVNIDPKIQNGDVKLGLQAEFQKTNASLAVAVAEEWLQRQGFTLARDHSFENKIHKGLEETKWGGRCETRTEPGIMWCIDGGHTLESITLAGRWFADVVNLQSSSSRPRLPTSEAEGVGSKATRFLMFNQQTRDADALAKALHSTLGAAIEGSSHSHPFTHAIFCTNTTFKEAGFRPDLVSVNTNASDVEALKVQKQLAQTWRNIDSETEVQVVRSIEEAVDIVRAHRAEIDDKTRCSSDGGGNNADGDAGRPVTTVLVTGSLHLVGGFLEVLEGSKQ